MATRKKVPQEEIIVDEPNEILPHDPVIFLYGDIDDDIVAEASECIISSHYLKFRPNKITILLNSEGGLLHSAFALIEVIKKSKIPIEIIALGQCVSAGVLIFMSGTKGMRTVTPTCTIMSHSFSTEIQGNSYDLNAIQKELKHTHDSMINHYIEHTELTKHMVETHLVGTQDRWLTPDDVVKFGIADKIGMFELPD